ncbi:MAG: 4-hydroxythreonine-4-phosphate dehydrogenase PdxA [Deltaproteobacteria bacterium]|nr:4-hydroxythreonine-4-phosphate dehydrogenase PdxA [Deltaproteobacteria bacterium]
MATPRKKSKPTIAVTMGDPRGIGPEVVAKALTRPAIHRVCTPLVLGDAGILRAIIDRLQLRLSVEEVGEGISEGSPGVLSVRSLSQVTPAANPMEISVEEGGRASFSYIAKAGQMVLAGQVDGMATGPVSKEAISRAGIPFRGHTEYLGEISATPEFVMMLAGKRLKVALVTTHMPLREVAASLKEEKILSVIAITGEGLKKYFHRSHPSIAVAGFNPHAGEGGLFGREEEIIARAIQKAGARGFLVSGPWPADSLFYRVKQGEFDGVVCMYHDQGLIPLKLLHFESAVNVTLGLPFIRTSVDHGVALDIAGKGVASSRSMEEAILMAAQMAKKDRVQGAKGPRVQGENRTGFKSSRV